MTVSGYSKIQIALHWSIAAMMIVQIVFHHTMSDSYKALSQSIGITFFQKIVTYLHVSIGLLLFVLGAFLLARKIRRGVPSPPMNEPKFLQIISKITHWMLYGILFVMPLTGSLAWFFDITLSARIHGYLVPVLFTVLNLHLLGVIYQRFILKSNVLQRMLKPLT